MREIKFRAWDEDGKEMIYNVEHTYDFQCEGLGALEWCFGSVLDDENYKVMQYTGIKDKHDKEIYEGDIVRYLSPEEEDTIASIVWDETFMAFMIQHPLYGSLFLRGETTSPEVEVIGNIYENPELLEAEDGR